MVVISILLQGLTMAPLLRRLGIVRQQEQRTQYERARAMLHAVRAALAELDHMEQTQYADADVLSSLRDEYRRRIDDLSQRIGDLHVEHEPLRQEELDEVRRRLIVIEKKTVIDAFHDGAVSREVYDRLLAELDSRLMEQ